jgi:putative hydrolase of the HAD superfamily
LDGKERRVAIEAVIFDFGGVFTTSPFEAFNRFEADRGLPADLIRRINAANPLENAWAKYERNDIGTAEFDELFLQEATALGHPVRGAEILPLLSGSIRPGMVQALKACKARYKVGCITNNVAYDGPKTAQLQNWGKGLSGVMPLFDAVLESSKAGVRKPDPRIYRMMCELLAVEPAACVYLDDLGINCKPAAALGMTAIKVVREAQALTDLSAVTGIPFGMEQTA